MNAELQINNSAQPAVQFVAWAPSPARVRITNPAGSTGPTATLRISGTSGTTGGAVNFRQGATGQFTTSLNLTVPTNNTWVPFFIAGRFGRPSTSLNDVKIEVRFGTTLVGSTPCTVRIRKNANTLTPGERDRFIGAFAQLNNQGNGPFRIFRDMHVPLSLPQGHGAPGFLPWHRAYLLDLERELQAIDASVALHYWRFDRPAANIFTGNFLGVADQNGTVQFSATNPLRFWATDGMLGINRFPLFPTNTAPPGLRNEDDTLALGGSGNLYALFRRMERNPHGFAHTSFGGSIQDPATAAKDPLFFLLHCNVDRLWAKWQKRFGRFDPAVAASFDSTPSPAGHNLPNTMWPWNGVTGGSRPPTAPGGQLAASQTVTAPGGQPRVRDLLDYQGNINATSREGFDYDDVPFV
jgi:tyrosinase